MNRAYELVKKPFFGRYRRPWRWPEAIPEADWQRLSIPSPTGGELAALYGPAQGPARGGIVCAHPMGVEAKGFFLKRGHAELLRRAGYHVLAFDFNGFGESSTGDFRYPLDVIAAGRALRQRAPGLPLGVLGVSFGAAWSLCALAQPDHGFSAAVLECPFTTLDEYWVRYRVPFVMLRVMSRMFPGLAADLRPIVQAARLRDLRALLFIYGEQDDLTPREMGERFMKGCALPAERVSLWSVPAAEHTRALAAAPEAYRARVLDLFDMALA